MQLIVISLIFVCGTLVYGYWHSVTHASFHISIHMLNGEDASPQSMPLADIAFLDASGKVLARGISDTKSDFVHLLHPDVGDCHELEKGATGSRTGRTAWQDCFAALSTWIPQWAEDVRTVDVTYDGLEFTKIPIDVSAYNSEWLLWWVPLPHVGGKPYTYYRARISVGPTNDKLSR